MPEGTHYSSRSAAIRAARQHCKRVLGTSFCAYEGHDFEIHPQPDDFVTINGRVRWSKPHTYKLRGPASEES